MPGRRKIWSVLSLLVLASVFTAANVHTVFLHTCSIRGTVNVSVGTFENESCHEGTCCMEHDTDVEDCSLEENNSCCQISITDLAQVSNCPPDKKNFQDAVPGKMFQVNITPFEPEYHSALYSFDFREKYGGPPITILQHRLLI